MIRQTRRSQLSLVLRSGLTVALFNCALSACSEQTEPVVALIEKAPITLGTTYKCSDMVRIVNSLRSLGKDKALGILQQLSERESTITEKKVILICRCLFENPQGWEVPRLGVPGPEVKVEALKQFPSFPMASSRSVPFLLVRGYSVEGRAESPKGTLEVCKKLPLIKADLPEDDFTTAAQALVNSKAFRQLYVGPRDADDMAAMILKQAGSE